MSTRYFKATDGIRTFFRASPTQAYLSLSVDPDQSYDFGWTLHRDGRGRFPAVEISRQEYKALVALKAQRIKGNAPRHSWVRNEDIEPRYADPQPNDGPARLALLFPGLGSRKII